MTIRERKSSHDLVFVMTLISIDWRTLAASSEPAIGLLRSSLEIILKAARRKFEQVEEGCWRDCSLHSTGLSELTLYYYLGNEAKAERRQ